jgi:hypothetical protein
MAGADTPPVHVVITGFGSFHGVASNPTQRLVGWLQQQYAHGGAVCPAQRAESASGARGARTPPPRALRRGAIHSCTVLKVSARAVGAYLTQQLDELKARGAAACAARAPGAACGPTVILLLHFGVDVHVSAAGARRNLLQRSAAGFAPRAPLFWLPGSHTRPPRRPPLHLPSPSPRPAAPLV